MITELQIEDLRKLYDEDLVFSTQHIIERCEQRNISENDIRSAICSGMIIEHYPTDYPWPSCLIAGHTSENKILHVVVSSTGEAAKLITAYWPDIEKWNADFTLRKE